MKKFVILTCCIFFSLIGHTSGGEDKIEKVEGKVIDAKNGDELTGVKVFIEGADLVTYTDRYGNFQFENLPQGDYKVHFSYISFEEQTLYVSQFLSENPSRCEVKMASR